MSDETVKQEAGAEVEAKKRRGRPRKQKADYSGFQGQLR